MLMFYLNNSVYFNGQKFQCSKLKIVDGENENGE